MDAKAERKYYQIGSLEKGLKIMEAIVEQGELTVTKAAQRLDINRASAHRFITTLRDMGYVRKNHHNNYEATFKLLELGMKQANSFEIRQMAKPYMRELSAMFDETVNLGILDRDNIIYLDKVESRELLRMDSGIGTYCPAYITALGKAILAFLPEEEQRAYLARIGVMEATTPNTITSVEKLEKALIKIKKNGYSVDNEELALGLYCVGAPIFDFNGHPVYALSVSGPVARIKPMKALPSAIVECAAKLSRQLGFRGNQPGLTAVK